jgi:hypothetical protein
MHRPRVAIPPPGTKGTLPRATVRPQPGTENTVKLQNPATAVFQIRPLVGQNWPVPPEGAMLSVDGQRALALLALCGLLALVLALFGTNP